MPPAQPIPDPATAAPEPQAPPQAPPAPAPLPSAPPDAATRLAALSRRLEAARPPMLRGDATDPARLVGWQDRCRAAREAAEAASGAWTHLSALPRGGGPLGAALHPHAPSER